MPKVIVVVTVLAAIVLAALASLSPVAAVAPRAPSQTETLTPASVVYAPYLLRDQLPATARPTATPTVTPTPTPGFDPARTTVRLEVVTGGLDEPIGVTHAGDGSGRLFVIEKDGRIRIVRGGALVQQPFLDIDARVRSAEFEQGLLGLVFHPNYRENGLFFVNYTNLSGDTVIARYRVSADADVADAASEQLLLTVDQPFANHNGGHLAFGPDGYLYVGLGDGGDGGDPLGNGQNPAALLGKMLRIDVDVEQGYRVPADNPFVGQAGYRPEIWAMGLRNPWRYAFDRLTGDLYIGDVGQRLWEEIDYEMAGGPGGANYGWNVMEGQHCYPPDASCDTAPYMLPIAEYSHAEGCSVTGGHVYRGQEQPALYGAYFFGDYCTGQTWASQRNGQGAWVTTRLTRTGVNITSFGEDEGGEVYVTGSGQGTLYRLVAAPRQAAE